MKLVVFAALVLGTTACRAKSDGPSATERGAAALSAAVAPRAVPSGRPTGLVPVSCVPLVRGTRGDGNLTTTVREASGFTDVELHLAGDLEIKEAPELSVEIETDRNIQGFVTVETKGKTLEIGGEGSYCFNKLHAVVTLPRFHAAVVHGGGKVDVTKTSAASDVSLEVNGSGAITFRGPAGALGATINGSGSVLLDTGAATSTRATVEGSGAVTKNAFEPGAVTKVVHGSGAVRL